MLEISSAKTHSVHLTKEHHSTAHNTLRAVCGYPHGLMADRKLWLDAAKEKKMCGMVSTDALLCHCKVEGSQALGAVCIPILFSPGMFLQPRISPCSSLLERTPRATPSPVGFSRKHSSRIPVHGKVSRGLGLPFRSKRQEGQLRASFGDREPRTQHGPHITGRCESSACRIPFAPAPSLISLSSPRHS